MRVHVVDPAAYTPPYDHALCAALARAGAEVELVTTPFPHAESPRPAGYARLDAFYRRRVPPRLRRAARAAQHVPDMLRYRSVAARAEVVHFQWLPVQQVDWLLLPSRRPRLITAHDVLPREASVGQAQAQKRIYERMDAVVVHSEHGAGRLREEAGLPADRVHVIPHGAFHHLAEIPPGRLPAELGAPDRPVVLFFGLLRPYKGLDVLLEAWRALRPDAHLWIVGRPRMDLAPLRARAPDGVRWVTRFVRDDELAAVFRTADLVVLPYREIDQSGVLFTALAFHVPLLLSDAGGFSEVARTGAAALAPAGDVPAWAAALGDLLADSGRRARMSAAARAAAAPDGPLGWDAIARRTLALYGQLLGDRAAAARRVRPG